MPVDAAVALSVPVFTERENEVRADTRTALSRGRRPIVSARGVTLGYRSRVLFRDRALRC
jgi:hypothetical protein